MSVGPATAAIEIFRTGRHRAGNGPVLDFSESDLAAAADAYDPSLSEAPIVVGHPRTNAPAFGWVRKLEHDADRLSAHAHQVDAEFVEAVRAGRYKKVSASFYMPGAATNPKPGVYYLRHVGFLGGAAPSVKGLRDVTFADSADDDGVVEFSMPVDRAQAGLWRGLREWLLGKFGQDEADRAVPPWDVRLLEDEAARAEPPSPTFSEPDGSGDDMEVKELAAREEALKQREAEVAAKQAEVAQQQAEFSEREQTLTAAEAKRQRAELAEFVEGLVKDGARVLPADKAPLVEFMAGLEAGSVVEFAEGDETVSKPAAEWFRGWLGRLPQQVDFAERSAAAGGVVLDNPGAIAEAAQRYQQEQAKAGIEVRVSDAVRHVTSR
jgi:hypothetical protein